METLYPYLDARWVEHFSQTLDRGASQHYYPKGAPNAGPPEAGASLERLRADVLDGTGVEAAIASCLYAVDSVHHPDVAAALAGAVNDWLTSEWLQPEPRLRGSVVVPIRIPALAVAEIDRVADRPGFVQVLIPARTEHPLGSRLFPPAVGVHRTSRPGGRHPLRRLPGNAAHPPPAGPPTSSRCTPTWPACLPPSSPA